MKPSLWALLLSCVSLPSFASNEQQQYAFLITQPQHTTSTYQWVKHALIESLSISTQHSVEEPGTPYVLQQQSTLLKNTLAGILKEAAQAADNLDYVQAETLYTKAAETAEQYTLAHGDTYPLRNTLASLSAASILLKNTAQTAHTVARIAALDPDFSPKPPLFNPEMQTTFNLHMQEALSHNTAQLTVQCPVQGCAVYINGFFKGLAPITEKNLLKGTYYIALSAPAYLMTFYKTQITSDTHTFNASPNPIMYQTLIERTVQPLFTQQTPTLPNAIQEIIPSHITHVYVLGNSDRTFILTSYNLTQHTHTTQSIEASPETPAQARHIVQQLLTQTAVMPPIEPIPSPQPTAPLHTQLSKHPYRSALIYSAYIFGAAATLTSIGLGARAIWLSDQYTQAHTSQLAGERYRSEGYNMALATDILLPLGLVSLGTGLCMQYLWKP